METTAFFLFPQSYAMTSVQSLVARLENGASDITLTSVLQYAGIAPGVRQDGIAPVRFSSDRRWIDAGAR